MNVVKVILHRIGPGSFEAANAAGHRVRLGGSPAFEAEIREKAVNPAGIPGPEPAAATPPTDAGAGLRPMELFLAALAGCSAVDVVQILTRQRQDLRDLVVDAEGVRVEAIPAVYETIMLRFTAHGPVDPARLSRAVELAVTKYCSVRDMLRPEVEVRWEAAVAP